MTRLCLTSRLAEILVRWPLWTVGPQAYAVKSFARAYVDVWEKIKRVALISVPSPIER